MENEAEWQIWFQNYTEFLLHYATLAQRNGIEALCIGTERSKTTPGKSDLEGQKRQQERDRGKPLAGVFRPPSTLRQPPGEKCGLTPENQRGFSFSSSFRLSR